MVYSTYLGGNGNDIGFDIGIDPFGNAFVTGRTSSTDFPIIPGAFQISLPTPQSSFLTQLSLNGSSLLYSTYIGGNLGTLPTNNGFGITVDLVGNTYAVGNTTSTNFPTTPSAFSSSLSGSQDAYVIKVGTIAALLGPTGDTGANGLMDVIPLEIVCFYNRKYNKDRR